MTDRPEHLEEWPEEYSNFDHTPPGEDAIEALKAGTHYVAHPAWDHWGAIWFKDGKFIEETKAYQSIVGTYTGDSINSVYEQANEAHGND